MSVNMSKTSLGNKCAALYSENNECGDEYRSIDGSCNHANHQSWGKAHTSYIRLLDSAYSDGKHLLYVGI